MIKKLEGLFIITAIIQTIFGVGILYFDFNKPFGITVMLISLLILVVGSLKFIEKRKEK